MAFVGHRFKNDKEIFDFLAQNDVYHEMQAKYPPPRYKVDLNLFRRQLLVEDTEKAVQDGFINPGTYRE